MKVLFDPKFRGKCLVLRLNYLHKHGMAWHGRSALALVVCFTVALLSLINANQLSNILRNIATLQHKTLNFHRIIG